MVDWSNVFYGVGVIVVLYFFLVFVVPIVLPIATGILKMIRFDASAAISKKEGYVESCSPYPR